MKFYKHLYVGKTVKNPEKVKWKLRVNAGQLNIYLIALAKDPDQLEFYNAAYLKQKYLRRLRPLYIIGIAGSYDEAREIIVKITGECYAKTGNANLKEYLSRDS